MIIIGITGTLGAGKGTVVDYLVKEKGFKHYSVRNLLIKFIKKERWEVNRDSMVKIANRLRKENGASFLAEKLLKEAQKSNKNCVIESIRTEGEVDALRKIGGFFLLAVDADPRVRYERIIKRGGETDHITFKEFMEDERREMTSKDPNKQNLKRCIELADYKIKNDGTFENLDKRVNEIVQKTAMKSKNYKRPSWDEYFTEIMRAVSTRGTCDRGHAACVFVKDKQILVTGYAGSPVGFPHCDEVGHDLRKLISEDGTISEHCVRTVHAEQNALCQAAKLGVALNGSTVYVNMTPCRTCAMLLINCGVKRIFAERKYHAGAESEKMFRKAKIKLEYKFDELVEYKNQKV